MKKYQRFLEELYRRKIQNQYDRIIPIIGDEGEGKSTLICQSTWLWQEIKGETPSTEYVLDRVVWDDRTEFKSKLSNSPRRSVIAVMDAARVLHKKEAMKGEQVEVEKDLLDVRTKEFLILLGFQDWDAIPTFLQTRRAKNAIYIPQRGYIYGYNRETLNERVKESEWPQPDLRDTFPSLEGTRLWEEFQAEDRKRKDARMYEEDEDEGSERRREVLFEIAEKAAESIEKIVSIHGGNGTPYIDSELIELEYGVSRREAKKVKKILDRDYEFDLRTVSEA